MSAMLTFRNELNILKYLIIIIDIAKWHAFIWWRRHYLKTWTLKKSSRCTERIYAVYLDPGTPKYNDTD